MRHVIALVVAIGTGALWLGAMAVSLRAAQLPDAASGVVVAFFPPGTGRDVAFARALAAGGDPVRRTAPGLALVVSGAEPGLAGRLRRAGAVLVLGDFPFGPVLAGCSGLGAPAGT